MTMPTLTGVLGFPVAHSRSPQIHNAAFAALGLRWRYLKLPVPPARLGETVAALPRSGYRGANVTIPHKRAALALANDATSAAAAIGAANTLIFSDGVIRADNTDAAGFLAALEVAPAGIAALVLGAGGAARAVAWALREAGAAEVSIWNRTPDRAAALAKELGARHADRPAPAELIVNATSVGLDPSMDERTALDALALGGLDPPPTLVDLPYRQQPEAGATPLAGWAGRAGGRVVDGLEVLVRQGAISFERWTGRAPPLEVMRAAARSG